MKVGGEARWVSWRSKGARWNVLVLQVVYSRRQLRVISESINSSRTPNPSQDPTLTNLQLTWSQLRQDPGHTSSLGSWILDSGTAAKNISVSPLLVALSTPRRLCSAFPQSRKRVHTQEFLNPVAK